MSGLAVCCDQGACEVAGSGWDEREDIADLRSTMLGRPRSHGAARVEEASIPNRPLSDGRMLSVGEILVATGKVDAGVEVVAVVGILGRPGATPM
jgi:hypothetical protein